MSLVLTYTTGRCGTLYLTEVFEQHKTGEQIVLHEEGGRPPWSDRITALCDEGKGLLMTGRNVAATLSELAVAREAKILVLVRDCVETCKSWYERIPAEHFSPEHVAARWPYGNPLCVLQRQWSEFQMYLWHWFSTYVSAIKVCSEADPSILVLSFKDLNNTDKMGEMLLWTEMMKPCTKESLAACLVSKNAKTAWRDASNIDIRHEFNTWMSSLDELAAGRVNEVRRWFEEFCNV